MIRAAALHVPPIRRLYTYAMQQAQENQERATALAALTAQPPVGAGEQQRLLSEMAAVTEERDALQLQLYVLRSDHQRAAARNQELGATLHAAEARAEQVLREQAVHNQKLEAALHAAEARAEQASREQALREQALVVRNQELGTVLHAAEARAEQVLREQALVVARNQELGTALQATEQALREQALTAERSHVGVTTQELSLLYAKLAGRMTLLSSEIARLRVCPPAGGDGTTLYLDLLERALTGMLGEDAAMDPWTKGYDPEVRSIGRDWPSAAQTMIGLARLRNLRVLAERVIQDSIPGDMLEAGVWRGGACILMRGVMAAHGITDRTVWVADSFAGLPAADPATYPADAGDQHATYDALRVSSEEVQAHFRRYGLLDRQVRFLKGWFEETLPQAPVDRLAILRLDGDMYSSTIQTLDALYNKVSSGGYVIIDDYILAGCRQAVDDFRNRHGINDELNDVDGAAVFWRKG